MNANTNVNLDSLPEEIREMYFLGLAAKQKQEEAQLQKEAEEQRLKAARECSGAWYNQDLGKITEEINKLAEDRKLSWSAVASMTGLNYQTVVTTKDGKPKYIAQTHYHILAALGYRVKFFLEPLTTEDMVDANLQLVNDPPVESNHDVHAFVAANETILEESTDDHTSLAEATAENSETVAVTEEVETTKPKKSTSRKKK